MALDGVNNGQQNEWKEKSMNTKSYSFYNKDDMNGSMLLTGFWNSCLTLKIHPIIPQSRRNGGKMFDMETFVNTALTPEKAMVLIGGIRNIATRIVDGNYDFDSIGVPIGSGFVEISNGQKFGLIKESICISIYSNIDENGITAERLTYTFNKLPMYTNYDSSDGNIDTVPTESEFMLFCEYLTQGLKATTNAIAHSIRNSNKYAYEKETNNINAIMSKLGISTESYQRNSNKPSGFFDNNTRIPSNDGEGLSESDINYSEIEAGGRLPIL